MGLKIVPDTSYPQKKDSDNSRWEGVYTFVYTGAGGDDYPAGGEVWEEPKKYFKTIKQLWFEKVPSAANKLYEFYYNQSTRKFMAFTAGSEATAGALSLSGRFVIEGRNI